MKTRIKAVYCQTSGCVMYFPQVRSCWIWWSLTTQGVYLESAKRMIKEYRYEIEHGTKYIIYPEGQ